MHEFFAKVVRLAFSKAAAFVYAVTVGVSGNLAFNYLQPKDQTPAPTALVAPSSVAAPAPATPAPAAPSLTPTPVSAPAEAARPGPARPVATAPILPEPPSASLPAPSALPAPALKPAALPAREPVKEAPREAAGHLGEPAGKPDSANAPQPPAPTATSITPLTPIGPAIDVAPLPSPASAPAPAATVAAAPPEQPAKRQPWELSDIWHPVRAVEKAGDWAGDQLPLIGGGTSAARPATLPVAKPISLLPPAAAAEQEPAKATVPVKPGPGSGGLY